MNGITRKLAPLVALAIFVLLLGAGPVLAAKKAKTPKPAALTINVKSGSKKLKLTRTQSIKVTLYCGTESKTFSGHSASAKFQLTPPCEFRAIAVVLDSNHAVAQGEVSATFTRKGSVDVNASALPQTGSITGVVRDSSGPLTGVAIATTSVSTTSGSDGRYWLSGLQPGSYTVTYDLAGYTPSQSTVTVTAGQETSANMFLAKPVTTGTVQGTVRLNGNQASGVLVTLDGVQEQTTGADGWFSFTGVEAGTHSLSFTGCYGCADTTRNVFIPAGQVTPFDFALTPLPTPSLVATNDKVTGPQSLGGLAIDNDNHILYATDGGSKVITLNPTTLTYGSPLNVVFNQPESIAYSAAYQSMVVLSGNGNYVWTNGTTKVNGQPGLHTDCSVLPDGRVLLVDPNNLKIATPQGVTIIPVQDQMDNLAVCGDERFYFVGTGSHGLYIVDATTQQVVQHLAYSYVATEMSLVEGTNLLIIGDDQGVVHVYDRVAAALQGNLTELQQLDFRDGSRNIVFGLVSHMASANNTEIFVSIASSTTYPYICRIRLQQ